MVHYQVSEKRHPSLHLVPSFEIVYFSIQEISQLKIPWLNYLSSEEEERYHQIQLSFQKSEFLYCRAFLRFMIAQILELKKDQIKSIHIHYTASGKPKFLVDQKHFIPFSVTHRLGFAAIIIASYVMEKDYLIGIDVEKESPWGKEYLTQWIRKEAYIKAFEKKPPMPFIPKEFIKKGESYYFKEQNIQDYFLACLIPKNVNVYSRQSLPILNAMQTMLD
jgi:hypothetical protein